MEVEWPPIRDPIAQRVWREVLRPIATQLRASAADLAEFTVTRIRADAPELLPDAQTVAEVSATTGESLRLLAQVIELGGDPRRTDLPPSGLAIIRSAVWRQVPVADHLRFYRLAHEQVWRWMYVRITAAARDAVEQATAVELATGWLFAFTDHGMTQTDHAYGVERETWLRGAAATRAAAIDDVIAHRERDGQTASRRLRYEVTCHHIGVIAWVDNAPDNGDALSLLNESIGAAARSVGAESSITHPLGSLAIAGWISSRCAFAPGVMDDLGIDSRTLPLPAGVFLAVGEPRCDLVGFRRTHLEAGHARRVASLVAPRGEFLTRYRDVAVAALCTADSDHALAFATRVLGPLAAPDEATFRLATTLEAYLRENRSRTRAAAMLSVHPNTVSYRVQQAEQLLGRSVNSGTLDLRVALTLLPTLRRLEQARSSEL